ncbi:MAG: TlpA family protein disulfide reductase [Ignavibacteriaceae bacterium]
MNNKIKNKKSWKRQLIEWGVIIITVAFLYYTGLYTEVLGRIQQVVLATGLLQTEIKIPANEQQAASYDLRLTGFDGNQTSLSDFKGKTIFLNFWASWCPPCRAEMPTIQSIYDKMKNKPDLVFVLVSLDEDTTKAKIFIKKEGFNFPVYFINDYLPQIYDTGTIPSTFIISKEGTIAAKRVGMYDYNTKYFIRFLNAI